MKKGRKGGKQVSSLTKSKGFADVRRRRCWLAVARFVGAGCDIRCGARRIRREGDTERENVEALLWRAALTSPRYISLEPALERIFCPSPLRLARTDLFAPLPPRRVPTIPVLGVLLPHSCTAEPYAAPEMLDWEMEYERPYTNHRATVLPGAPFSFFLLPLPARFFSFYSIWSLPFFNARHSPPSYGNPLSLSFIAYLPLYQWYLSISISFVYTRCTYSFPFSIICILGFFIQLEFTAHWCPSRKSNVS